MRFSLRFDEALFVGMERFHMPRGPVTCETNVMRWHGLSTSMRAHHSRL